jgi:hypothetical protein
MTELTIYPALFVMPTICGFVALVSRNKTAVNLATIALAAAVVLTVMASNPVVVSDSITKLWHQCQNEMDAGSKACRIQFGAVTKQ